MFFYKKFYPNGRYYSFCVEKNKNGGKLKEENLNPFRNRDGYYYCNKKRNIVKCETFVIAGGVYLILKYKLSPNGDTLTGFFRGVKDVVYIKEKIPAEWKRYKPNW